MKTKHVSLLKTSFFFALTWLGIVQLSHAHTGTNGWPNDIIDAYDYLCQRNQDGLEGVDDCTSCAGDSAFAMVRWRVSEPYLTLWLHDVPFAYSPSQGPPIAARLSYKHRGSYTNSGFSSFGTNWGCHWFGYVYDDGTNQRLVSEGAAIPFTPGSLLNYKLGAYAEKITQSGQTVGYRISLADGSREEYRHVISTGTYPARYLLQYSYDRHGFRTEFRYSAPLDRVVREIIDCDGKTNVLSYAHAITNLVTSIQDPYGRIAQFQYDANGRLTNIIDVATNSSVLKYDASGIVTNLTTPYGITSFKITQSAQFQDPNNTNRWVALGGTNIINRSIEITQPDQSKQLYLYRDDSRKLSPGSSVDLLPASFSLPSTGAFSNKFEDSDLFYRNSFHWNRQQYEAITSSGKANYSNLTTNDYLIATLKHWLGAVSTNGEVVSDTLSMIRAPSPDGYAAGQLTWHDYAGQNDSHHEGTNSAPRFTARILPDSTSWFERSERDVFGNATNIIGTYSVNGAVAYRTNDLKYDGPFKQSLTELSLREGGSSTVLLRAYYSLNGGNQLLYFTNALGEITANNYDQLESGGRLTGILRPSGLNTTNFYYTSGVYTGWVQQIVDYTGTYTVGASSNRVHSFTYTNGLVHTYTDPRGLTVTNTWDPLQRLTSVAFPGGTFFSNRYDKLDLIAARDRLGNWSYFGYDTLQRLTAITNANGVVTRYGYCDCGSVESVTNAWTTPAQLVVSLTHDYQGNRTHVSYPDATVTNWFDSLGRVTTSGNGQGYRSLLYNNQGLVTNIYNALGTEQALVYDILDRPIYVTDANGVTVTNTFDNLNRLLTRTYPGGAVERFTYSARGLVAYTNQIGQPTLFGRDAFGRVTSVTNGNQETLFYTYNPAGDLLTLKDGKSQVTTWNCDEYGRATNKLDQAGVEVLRFKYDPNHRLTNRWSKAKGDTKYNYDPLGNLTAVNYPNSPDVSFAFDPLNRLTNMVDIVLGTTAFAYAPGGQLLTEDGLWSSDTVTNGYLNRLRTSLVLQQPTGTWTNGFRYDAAWRLTNVTSQAGAFNYTYSFASPLPLKLLLPNTSYITNTYDTVARLTGTWLKNSSSSTLNSHEYVHNPANQRTQQVFNAGSTYNYTYDSIGQLKIGDSATASEDRGYTYDAAWNLNYRTNNGVLGTFGVEGRNQLTNAPSGAAVYDDNGNLVISHNEARGYAYDDENRLLEVFRSPDKVTQYVYDGLGRLRIRREYSFIPSLLEGDWQVDSETRYVYDGMLVIQERDGFSNTPLVSYTRGNDLSGSLEGAGGIGGLLARSHGYSSGNWTNHNFYHADGGGNITYLVNSSQTLSASYRYDPFGNTISSSGSLAAANVYRFSSKEIHTGSGLYYYGFRFYDPNLHRWLNRDPMGEPGGINLYGFAGNRPINEVDPYGLYVLDEDGFPILGTGTAMDSYLWDPDLAAEIRAAEQQVLDEMVGVGTGVASFCPGIGETMDAATVADTGAPWWDRALAGASLGINGIAGGVLPNYSALRRAAKTGGRPTTTVLSDVTVISKGKVVGRGDVYLRPTIEGIESGKISPRDIFQNRPLPGKTTPELPVKPPGYYQEFVHPTPGVSGAGSQRIVRGAGGEMYYTPDHYATFVPLN